MHQGGSVADDQLIKSLVARDVVSQRTERSALADELRETFLHKVPTLAERQQDKKTRREEKDRALLDNMEVHPEVAQKLLEEFDILDANGDGVVSFDEYQAMFGLKVSIDCHTRCCHTRCCHKCFCTIWDL